MGFANRALVAAAAGFAAAVIAGCGSSSGSLLSASQSNTLSEQLNRVEQALDDSDCTAARQDLADFQSTVDGLGGVNSTLVADLDQGASTIESLAGRDCQTPPARTTTTVKKPLPKTTTATTPTQTTSTFTTPSTTSTSTYTAPNYTTTTTYSTPATSPNGGSCLTDCDTTTTTATTPSTVSPTTTPTGGTGLDGGGTDTTTGAAAPTTGGTTTTGVTGNPSAGF